MRIRKAIPEDWPRISEISRIAGYNDYINNIGEVYLKSGLVLVAEDEMILGFSKADFLPDNSTWLGGLRVDPDFRRKGIARKLTASLMEESRKAGYDKSRLLIEDGNFKSISLAEKVGFTRIRTYSYFKGGIETDGYEEYSEDLQDYLNLGWEYAFSGSFETNEYGKFYRKGKNRFFRSTSNGFCQVLSASTRLSGTDEGITCAESDSNLEKFISLEPLEDFKSGHLYEKVL